MPHQSDVAFLTWLMPNLNPASVREYLEFGLYGIALSRYSGMWVGFKAISETVESAMSIDLPPYPNFVTPDYTPPPGGLHIRWPDFPGPQIEERLEAKKAATLAFAEANPIDRKIFDIADARYGIVTTGKSYLQYYIEYIQDFQKRARLMRGDDSVVLPLVLMTLNADGGRLGKKSPSK